MAELILNLLAFGLRILQKLSGSTYINILCIYINQFATLCTALYVVKGFLILTSYILASF